MQEALQKQKEQCIFCKIIQNEIPSHKIYKDETVLAILDIHPAAKGHTLVLPTEHYPLLPLVPKPTRLELFTKLKYITKGVKKASVVDSSVLFIANGGIAGQQAPHVLIHCIPREKGDSLVFEQQKPTTPISKEKIAQNTQKLKNRFAQIFFSQTQPQQQQKSTQENKDKLLTYIHNNPQIQELLRTKPEQFSQVIKEEPELQKLFEGIDVFALSEQLNKQEMQTAKTDSQTSISAEQKKEIATKLETDEKLRNLLIHEPLAFIEKIKVEPELEKIFSGVDILTLAKKLKEAYNE